MLFQSRRAARRIVAGQSRADGSPALMKEYVLATLNQATDEGYVGALLQSCVDACSQYDA